MHLVFSGVAGSGRNRVLGVYQKGRGGLDRGDGGGEADGLDGWSKEGKT